MRGISGCVARAVGARIVRAARTAASPMAWIWRGDAAGAGPRDTLARPSGSVIQTPRRWSGGSGRSGSASMSSSSAAVRDPSDPSAKHFCQPTRARPSGSSPSGVPLR